jgi:quercetin dioxygenase-like cupin family protein
MRNLAFTLLLAAATQAALAQTAPTAPQPVLPDAVQWQGNPAAPGLQAAWFIGVPGKPGLYAQRVRLASGGRIPPHTHPDERISIVLSGTIYVGFGESFDESKVVTIPTGAVYIAPAGVPHYVWAKDGDAVYQETGPGPTDTKINQR